MYKKLLVLLTLLLWLHGFVTAQKKIALIVAVAKYPPEQRDWKKLSSDKDLLYIREALLHNGFALQDIDTLTDAKATKAGMINAIDALIAKANSGDIVYFHFSGHGQQIEDSPTDGILDEADGYDEALIPYDAKGKWDDVDYHGEKHFRDDLLGDKLNALRKKVGLSGSVVVVIDACHSGTATRSAGIVRGDPIPCQRYGYKPNVVIDLNKNPETGFLDNMGKDMGSLVVFSGSSPNQVNRETKDEKGNNVGSLSYAFAKSITNLPANANYQQLFQKIKAIIQADEPTQVPMLEGNAALRVFSNQYTVLKEVIIADMFLNNTKNGMNDTTFFISRGAYQNVQPGTTVKVMKLGDTAVFCRAVVKEVNAFQSVCVAEKSMPKTSTYEVKIDELSYGAIAASYLIQNKIKAKKVEQQLNNFFKPQSFLSVNENPDYTISIDTAANGKQYKIDLYEKNDSVRYSVKLKQTDSLSADDLDHILEDIKKGMRVRYLRKMEDGGSLASFVKVNIVPANKKDTANELILYPNEDFSLELTSNYEGELYYTILDLLPDNDVKVLVPDSTSFAADYSIRKGQVIKIPMGTDSTSLTGKEFLKVIFSTKPIDLRPSFQKFRTRSIAAKPMEKMMDDLFPKDKNSKTRAGVVKLDDIGIITTGFTLKKQ